MNSKQIFFTGKGKAELIDVPLRSITENEVLVETSYIPISAGTERACLMRMPNTGDFGKPEGERTWGGGYSSSGIVKQIGKNVKGLNVGDRVLTFWSQNTAYNILGASNVIKIPNSNLDLKYACFAFIASFPAAAIRKTRLEFGESAIVFGMGILGAFAIQLLRAAGAFPIIAVDLLPERRNLALKSGADYAFDPIAKDFVQNVKNVTDGKGARVVIEVTGKSAALSQSLDCVAEMGRIALLGCTRISNTEIDFYRQIHRPGITLIGAHTDARPKIESSPHNLTERDECTVMLNFMSWGRLDMTKILSEVNPPEAAPKVYKRLAEDKEFPVGVVFEWNNK